MICRFYLLKWYNMTIQVVLKLRKAFLIEFSKKIAPVQTQEPEYYSRTISIDKSKICLLLSQYLPSPLLARSRG
jgi:hypothetical protein